MDIMLYVLASAIYIMLIHFAVAIKNQFNLFLMIAIFAIGAGVGMFIKSLETGFIVAMILSLVFW